MSNQPDVSIQRILAEHADGFHRVYDFVARERKYLAALQAHPLARTREFVMNNIAKGYPQFVAISANEVVGWCDIIPMSSPAHAHVAKLGMGLLPSFRGRGIGQTLVEKALSDARRLGLARIELTVHADNRRAISLYDRMGFKKEGLAKDAVFIDGVYKDVIMMALVERSNEFVSGVATPPST